MNCKVCGNTSTKSTSVSFFRFPKENEKCRDWAERCNLLGLYEKHGPLRFYKSFRICSAHFDPKDIVFDGRKKRLLHSALPNLIKTESAKEEKLNDMESLYHGEVLNLKLVEKLCRLCAKEDKNLTDIYGCQGRILNLEGKLKYFPLMINRYDVLPLRVCRPCVSKVNQFHDFIIHCMKAETRLRVMLDLEVCDTSCRLLESSADPQVNVTQEPQNQTPSLESPSSASGSPELTPHFTENVDDYYDQVLQNNYVNEDCLCDQTKFVRQSQNQPEPGFVETIQLTNHTNYIKQVDFNSSISFEHDYSNITSRDQLTVESNVQTLQDDDQVFREGKTPPCRICFESFRGGGASTHSVQPGRDGELNCEACDKLFFTRMEFDVNISHHPEGSHACKICGKKFHKVAFLEEHPFLRPSENSCHGFSDSRDGLTDRSVRRVLKNHFPRNDDYFRPSRFYLESYEKMHQKDIRELNKNHTSEKSNLKSRKRRCQFCDRLFKNRQVCLAHEKSHTGETPYQCKECGKRFRSRPSLRQHRSVHSDKRLHNCQECGMSFKRKDTLSNHFRIHTGERPFVCKVCGFAFKQRGGGVHVSGDCIKHEKNHQRTAEVRGEKLRQRHKTFDVTNGGSVTEDFTKTGLPHTKAGSSANDGENSSLPSYFPTVEVSAALDPLEDSVVDQFISFNF